MSENAEITGVISPEDAAKAEKFKEEANEYFKSSFTNFPYKFDLAIYFVFKCQAKQKFMINIRIM